MTSDEYFLAVTAIQNRLRAYILSLLADRVAAQDVLQETNLVLIRKADDFHSDASFESWAYSTARFQVLAHLRDCKWNRLVLHESFAEKLAPSAEVMAEDTEQRIELLGRCVEQLSDEHNSLLHKRYGRDISIAKLAEDVWKTALAMKQVLYRIRTLLADCVEQHFGKGAGRMSKDDRSQTVLIQEMLDGVLDDKQRAGLLKRVEFDDAARKLYLDQIATHRALRAVLADGNPRRDVDHHQAMSQQAIHPGWFSRFPGGSLVHAALAATILLLVFGSAHWWSRLPVESMAESTTESASAAYIVVISQVVGSYDDGIAIRAGQQVVSGQLNLDRGLVRLEFFSDATVVVEGPATVDLVDEMRVVLLRGVVTTRIPESAIDFVVDTHTARVVDLGTAFGAAVADDGTTDVVVFEGDVSVRKKGLISNSSTLAREGEAVRAF